MNRFHHIIFLTLLLHYAAGAQNFHTTTTRSMAWESVNVNWKFRPSWTSVSDLQFRSEITDGDIYQVGIRTGISYKFQNGIMVTAGPAFFLHYPNPNGTVPKPEYRGWEEVGKRWEFSKHHIIYPRLRLEQRFFREYEGTQLSEHIAFGSWRIRLRLEYTYNFGIEPQHWSALIGDEILFYEKPSGFSAFDQNRIWIGGAYRFNDRFTLQLLYLYLVQIKNSSNTDIIHVIRLTFQFNFVSKAAQAK